MKKWQPASVESGKKAKTHLSMQWTYLTAGNKKGVILITYAAVWAELSLRFCTNCSESIKLFNPKERFPVTFRVRWPWEPFASERWDTCFFLLFLFYRNHWLERDRGETGRQTGDKEGGYILSDLLRSSMLLLHASRCHFIIESTLLFCGEAEEARGQPEEEDVNTSNACRPWFSPHR